jgi:hypothetical protein
MGLCIYDLRLSYFPPGWYLPSHSAERDCCGEQAQVRAVYPMLHLGCLRFTREFGQYYPSLSLLGPDPNDELTGTLKPFGTLERAERLLNLLPGRRALGFGQPSEHLVQRPERLACEAHKLGR